MREDDTCSSDSEEHTFEEARSIATNHDETEHNPNAIGSDISNTLAKDISIITNQGNETATTDDGFTTYISKS